jgi:hypothetical protein
MTTWAGQIPKSCDTCGDIIVDTFYDAATTHQGRWACMCATCFTLGPGVCKLGQGFGQKYEKQANGKFIKTGG